MKTNKKYIPAVFVILLFLGYMSCIDGDCGNSMGYDSLHISFTVTDSTGRHYQRNFNMDSIKIYLLDSDEEVGYRVQWTRIDLSLVSDTPYIGEHDLSFGIEWEENNIDTLRVLYSVGEVPEGYCKYAFEFETCYFNGQEFDDLRIFKQYEDDEK